MGSVLAIVGYRLRARVREPGTLAIAAVGLAALVGAVFAPAADAGGAATGALNALLVVGFLGALEAATAGGILPGDRAEGRADWLATLAPPPALHRAGTLLAAALAPVVACVAAATVVAVVATFAERGVPTFDVTSLDLSATDASAIVRGQSTRPPRTVLVPTGAPGVLEVDLRPVYRDPAAANEAEGDAELTWSPVGRSLQPPITQQVRVPLRGSFTISHSAEDPAEHLSIRSRDPRVDLVVTGARIRGEFASFATNVLLAGLLLGLAAAFVVPIGVLASRATSAPTAALLSALVLLLGVARHPIASLASDLAASPGGAVPAAILRGAMFASPDLSCVGSLSDVVAGRSLTVAPFFALASAAVYAAVVGAIAIVLPDRKPKR